MSHFYGLKPRDLDDMTVDETNEYLRQLEEYEKAVTRGD